MKMNPANKEKNANQGGGPPRPTKHKDKEAKQMTEKLLTPSEVAKRLGVTLRTVQRWIAEGELPSYKLGKVRRVSEKQLEEFLRYKEEKAKWQDGGGKR